MNTRRIYEKQKVYDYWEQVEEFANVTQRVVICVIPVDNCG